MVFRNWLDSSFSLGRRNTRKKWTDSRHLRAEPLESRDLLAVITVNDLSDTVVDDGQITLREAIIAANLDTLADAIEGTQAGSGHDEIRFDALLTGSTITVEQGEMHITEAVSIVGLGAENLTISGAGQSRIFYVKSADPSVQVSIADLHLTRGKSTQFGGTIKAEGKLSLSNMVIDQSTAAGGGAIHVLGDATITDSRFEDNSASNGGAMYVSGGQLMIADSQIAGNTASSGSGGGIYVASGDVNIIGTGITDNVATVDGGAIEVVNSSTILRLHDSAIVDNKTEDSG